MLSRTITENDDLKYCITDSIMSDKKVNVYVKYACEIVHFTRTIIRDLDDKLSEYDDWSEDVIEAYNKLENDFLQIENKFLGDVTYFTLDIKAEDKTFSFDNAGINKLNEQLVEFVGRASKLDRKTDEYREEGDY